MEPGLKARMLDAAADADKLWQRNIAKALTDGIAEIERLLGLLADVQQVQRTTMKNMETLLPFLRRLENPTQEMRAAMTLGDTPYVCQEMDGELFHVLYVDPAGKTAIIGTYSGRDDAWAAYHQVCFEWRYSEMLRVAAEQPLNLTNGEPQ